MGRKRGTYNFKRDINVGEKGEIHIGRFLRKKGLVFDHKLFNGDYDMAFRFNNNLYTYEVKTDVYKKNTGNMVIEFESRGKPSGITTTKADYFVYFFPYLNEIWNIKTDELRKLISDNELKIKHGGDRNLTKMYILPKNKFREHFKFYKWR
jgi:hypothetical protein